MSIRRQLRRVLGASVIVLALSVPSSLALAHGTVDQSSLANTGSNTISSFQPAGQEFTPDESPLVGVAVGLDTANPGSGDDTLTVNIRKGDITSAVLATKAQVVTDGFAGLLHFDLPSPLTVTPGDVYVLEVQASKATFGWITNDNDYSGGRAVKSGVASATSDFQFQTFTQVATPVPGMSGPTLGALAALLVGAFVVVSRRRRRATVA